MAGVSNAELAAAVSQLVEASNAREQDLFNWQEGVATGGPYGDGRYPLKNYVGTVQYFKSPRRMQYEIDLLTAAGSGAVAQAIAAKEAAEAASGGVAASASSAASAAANAGTSATQADTFRQQAASSEANALTHRNAASTSATEAKGYRDTALEHRNAAATAKNAAEAAQTAAAASAQDAAERAAAAALFDVANFYSKTETDQKLAAKADTGHNHDDRYYTETEVDTKLAAKAASSHTHTVANVTGLQAALDSKLAASTVSTFVKTLLDDADAATFRTTLGLGTAATQASTAFAPAAHAHVINDVTGLRAELDGKASSSHTHTLASLGVSDFAATLLDDADAASFRATLGLGSAALSAATAFAAAGHTHAIADITGLQAALDGKLAISGVTAFAKTILDDADAAAVRATLGLGTAATTASTAYATANHTHSYLPLAGGSLSGNLQTSGKLTVGGTFSASYALEVVAPGTDGYAQRIRAHSNGTGILQITNSAGSAELLKFGVTPTTLFLGAGPVPVFSAASSNGNIGFGMEPTADKLSVSGNLRVGNGGDIIVTSALAGRADALIYNDFGDLILNTGGSPRLHIKTDGGVGVGTTDAQAKFHVADGTMLVTNWRGAPGSAVESADWPVPVANLSTHSDFDRGTPLAFTLPNDGNWFTGSNVWNFRLVGITNKKTSDANTHLELTGPGWLSMNAGQSGGVALSPGSTSWGAWSDERLKVVTGNITGAAAKVSSLRAIMGRYKDDPEDKRRPMLIAQDVQKVLPEAVTTGTRQMAQVDPEDPTRVIPTAEYLMLNYTDMIPLLVAAIGELTEEIASLKAA